MKRCALILLVILSSFTLKAQNNLTAKQIIERYIQLSGSFSGLENSKVLVSSNPIDGRSLTLEIIRDSSNRFYQVTTQYKHERSKKNKVSETIQIYNEGKAIEITNGNKKFITDSKALEGLRLDSYLFMELGYIKENYSLILEGEETIEGSSCYKIKIVSPKGVVKTNYYDKETGLLTYIHKERIHTYLKDYAEVNGKFINKSTILENSNGLSLTFNLQTMTFNEKLEPNLFSF